MIGTTNHFCYLYMIEVLARSRRELGEMAYNHNVTREEMLFPDQKGHTRVFHQRYVFSRVANFESIKWPT